MLQTIEKMPRFGSPMVSDSVRRQYGPDVRKALVLPFEIIHEYDQDTDTAYVYTLLYAPAVT